MGAEERLVEAAQAMTAAERVLSRMEVDPAALAVSAPGLAGQLGRALHQRVVEALTARSREATDAARRLGEVADALRTTADRYADVDAAASRRMSRET
jgi:hypothetical protein